MWDAVGRGIPRFAAFRRIASRKLARNRGSGSSNPLPSHTAERPPVSLAAAAVQARRGPARPEGAIEISRTSATDRSFLNCEPGVRVTPGAPILRMLTRLLFHVRRPAAVTCLVGADEWGLIGP